MAQLSFDEIKGLHAQAQATNNPLGAKDLKGFAATMQQYDQDNDWSQGSLPDNFVTGVSRAVDKGFAATGIPEVTGDVGASFGGLVDSLRADGNDNKYSDIGRSVGQYIPRAATGVGLAIAGTAALPASGGGSMAAYAPAAALLGLGAGDAAIKGYSDTGSVGAGAVAGATAAFAPGISNIGTKLGLGVLGKAAPALASSPIAKFVAAEIGQEAAFFGAGAAGTAATGEDPFTPENIFAQAVGTAAFAPLTVARGISAARAPMAEPAFVPAPVDVKGEIIPFDKTINPAGERTDVVVNNDGALYDFVTGKQDPQLKERFERGDVKGALELTGLIDPDISAALETTARRYKGREMISTLAEQNDAGYWEANERLFRKAATLLQTPEVEVRNIVQLVAANNAFARKFQDSRPFSPAGFLENKPSFDLQQQYETMQQTFGAGAMEASATRNIFNEAQASEETRTAFNSLPKRRAQEQQAESNRYGNPYVNPDGAGTPVDYTQPTGLRPGAVRGRVNTDPGASIAPRTPKGYTAPIGDTLPKVRGRVDPNALENKLLRPEWSQMDDSPGDSNIFRFAKGAIEANGDTITKLGSTAVPASGVMHENRFLSSTQMPKEVFGLVKQVYPEAWTGDQVNVNKLRELEKTRPMFETHVYGQDGTDSMKARRDQLTHDLETQGYSIDDSMGETSVLYRGRMLEPEELDGLPVSLRDDLIELESLASEYSENPSLTGPRATSYYNTISPFDTTKYPVVRVDVTVPLNMKTAQTRSDLRQPITSETPTATRAENLLWRQDDLHENLPNTLGWAMVQFVPHPETGETVMFLAEQQSRWGQTVAKMKSRNKELGWTDKVKIGEDHPLLDLQHKLVLKAAMDEARKRGVTKMVVSDGETAMMTERHDAASVMDSPLPFNEGIGRDMIRNGIIDEEQVDYARRTGQFDFDSTPEEVQLIARIARDNGVEWTGVQQPSQAGGMRQHYDKLLQSAAEKMTKSKGVPVDMGEHKNAYSENSQTGRDAQGRVVYEKTLTGSPVFRNADGTPKATATGKMYDISPPVVDNARYSLIDNSLIDKNGEITRETLNKAYQENLKLESDPERAMARLDLQVRGALMDKMKNTRPDIFVRDGLDVASRAFDSMGLSASLKQEWLGATHRLLNHMSVFEGTKVKDINELAAAGLIPQTNAQKAYGVYLGGVHTIGLSLKNVQATPELNAFTFVKVLGHEAFHAVKNQAQFDAAHGIDNTRFQAYKKAIEFADKTDPVTREGLLQQMQMALVPPDQFRLDASKDNRLGNVAKYAASTSDEFVTEYASMLAMSMSRPPEVAAKVQESLRWAPQAIQDFAHGIFRTMSELKQMVLNTAQFLGLGRSQIQELNQFQENLKFILTPDPVVVKSREAVQAAIQPFNILNGEYSVLDAQWSKMDSPAVEEATASVKRQDSNMLERRFGTLQQHVNTESIKQFIPQAKRIVDMLQNIGPDTKKMLNAMRSHLMVEGEHGILTELGKMSDKKLTPEQIALKSNFAIVHNSYENRVKLSEVYRMMDDLQTATNDPVMFDHPEIQRLVSGMSDKDRGAVESVFNAQIKSNMHAANLIKIGNHSETVRDVARVYKGAGLTPEAAMQAASIAADSVFGGKPLPPELNSIAGTDNAVNYLNAIKPAYEEFNSRLDRPHASELRTGRYHVLYESATESQDKPFRTSANNKQELAGIERQLKKDGYKVVKVEDNQNKPFNEFDAVPTRIAQGMLVLEQARYQAALEHLDPAAAETMRSRYTLGQGVTEELNKRKQMLAERSLAPGREYIDMYANQNAYSEMVAASVTKREIRDRIAWEMEAPEWKSYPALQSELKSFAEEVLNSRNGSPLSKKIGKATLFVTMGANISGAIVDSTQSILSGVFQVAKSMGVAKAYGTVAKGYLEASNPTDGEYKQFLARAQNDGKHSFGSTFESTFSVDDTASYNISQTGERRNLAPLEDLLTNHEFMAGKVMDMVKDYGGKIYDGMMIPTKASGTLNYRVMLYAGMVEGRQLGLKGEQLYQHATNVASISNYEGGRGAQSSFKTKFGEANNWVGVATLLSNYPISLMSQMYGNYRDMLQSSGLPPAKRQRAKEVFAGQLTAQFAMAGSLGLGLGTLFKLAEKVFGFSPEEEVRKALTAVDESGNLADIVMHGLANKATGIDLASRFSLGGVLGLNDYTGFDAKGVFGPSTALWTGIAKMPADIASGTMDKTLLLPNGIRKMLEASKSGPVKDRNGQTLIDPTTTEKILKFVGFNSDRLAKVRQQRSLYKFADDATSKANQIKTNERIELLNAGRFDEVLKSLQVDMTDQISTWKAEGISPIAIKKMVEKETRSNALQLVNAAVKKTIPLDPLGDGNAASSSRRRAIAASFGGNITPREVQSEQQALAARFLQGLGQAQVARSPRSVRIANAVQGLITQDPTLTEQQARMLAEQSIR
jgi:hypothetical protein